MLYLYIIKNKLNILQTPLYKKLKNNGTTFYAFPSADNYINNIKQNENYKVYFSKFVLLDLPKQNTTNLGGTQSTPKYFDFSTFSSISQTTAGDYSEQMVESLRNYVANHEVVVRESRLNNTDYYYDVDELTKPSEKIFWKWCKKLNLIDFDPAQEGDEYFSNLEEFKRNNLSDDSYFREYLWKERDTSTFNVTLYEQSSNSNFSTKLELSIDGISNLRENDIIELKNFDVSGTLPTEIFGSTKWSTVNVTVLDVTTNTSNSTQKIIVDLDTTVSQFIETEGTINLKYQKLVQYIGEITGVSNVKQANKSYVEVYSQIPEFTGQTPDILFRTLPDENYKPSLQFPIIPSQYQPEIVGAEDSSSPIVRNPSQYAGNRYGQFDTEDFTYVVANGDSLRRSGDFYGVTGDVNTPSFNGSTIDGINIDFNTEHYVKMNIEDREVSNFNDFNALPINGNPPNDFEYNAILWYYTIEDSDGNQRSNLYGISFLNNPNNNEKVEELGIKFPSNKKLVQNDEQDGTAYSHAINQNFNIIDDSPKEAYNPDGINSVFSMNLFNKAMQRLSETNDLFTETISENTLYRNEIEKIKQRLYNQQDINTINNRISEFEKLLQRYQTNELQSSDSISVETTNDTPPKIILKNNDTNYNSISKIKTSNMYNTSGSTPINVTPPNNKNFLINVINDDEQSISLPDDENLSLVLSKDLSFKQKVDILITGTENSTQNKKLDIYINTPNFISSATSSVSTETLIIGDIDLPVFYNDNTSQNNTAFNWNSFNFDIDLTKDIDLLTGNLLQLNLEGNSNIIQNSIKKGDYYLLNNLFLGTQSIVDYSGQYKVDNVNNNEITFDISNNEDLVLFSDNVQLPYNIHSATQSNLSNSPYISLNKGYKISITKIDENNNLELGERYFLEIKNLEN